MRAAAPFGGDSPMKTGADVSMAIVAVESDADAAIASRGLTGSFGIFRDPLASFKTGLEN